MAEHSVRLRRELDEDVRLTSSAGRPRKFLGTHATAPGRRSMRATLRYEYVLPKKNQKAMAARTVRTHLLALAAGYWRHAPFVSKRPFGRVPPRRAEKGRSGGVFKHPTELPAILVRSACGPNPGMRGRGSWRGPG